VALSDRGCEFLRFCKSTRTGLYVVCKVVPTGGKFWHRFDHQGGADSAFISCSVVCFL
jgi:hypothetical protein